MNLNKKQQEAINQTEWPLLIIAWAWSWKTTTLAHRVKHMITQKDIPAKNIMMVTFTNKASKEMREKVAKTMWITPPKNIYTKLDFPLIWTFHSIWIFLLKETMNSSLLVETKIQNLIWIKKDFVIYDETDKLSILKSILKNELKLDEKKFPAKKIATYISNAKNNLLTLEDYKKNVDSYIKEIVFETYKNYEKTLVKNNALDFDDILLKTLKILQIPEILEKYQEKYKYLMVDEYQDTNKVQYKITKLLASKYKNIAVVWDDSQSIYSWRWANMNNIINFEKDYKNTLVIKLEQNYRSTKNILSWSNTLIQNNSSWIKKKLWTDNQTWEKISYIQAINDKLEANTIANIITSSKSEWWKYSDNLVLYRTNAQSRQIEEAFLKNNIPYKIIWGLKFYNRKEIKDILSYLKVIYNSDDLVSIKRIINIPPRKIWSRSIEILDNYKNNFELPYKQVIENVEEINELRKTTKESIKSFWNILKKLTQKSKEINVADLIGEIIKITNYEEYIIEWLTTEEAQTKKDNINELISVASEYNWMEPRDSLSQFLEEVSLISDMDIKDERSDYVTLMTIHIAKWLEEKNVFVTWLEESIFPSFRSVNDVDLLEEERRLMYVAMTRAKEKLYISRAKERFYFWNFVKNKESRFVLEIQSEFLEEYKSLGNEQDALSFFSQESCFDFSKESNNTWRCVKKVSLNNNDVSTFSLWDNILHTKFWTGYISELNWEIASISFKWVWTKKMNIRIAPVKKI
jgi:DNA helicase II / ATP-dependent DNA helicase PcrA